MALLTFDRWTGHIDRILHNQQLGPVKVENNLLDIFLHTVQISLGKMLGTLVLMESR